MCCHKKRFQVSGFKVSGWRCSWFTRFQVSGFRFQGFRFQVGVALGLCGKGAIGFCHYYYSDAESNANLKPFETGNQKPILANVFLIFRLT